MRKLLATGAVALMLALSACNGGPGPTETVTATATATVTETISPSPSPSETIEEPLTPVTPTPRAGDQRISDASFGNWIKDKYPAMAPVPTSTIVELAKNSCNAFDSGSTLREVLAIIVNGNASKELERAMAGTVGAGVANYCPRHLDKIG